MVKIEQKVEKGYALKNKFGYISQRSDHPTSDPYEACLWAKEEWLPLAEPDGYEVVFIERSFTVSEKP